MSVTSKRMVLAEGQEISYVLERKQVKNLNLRIRKDGSVFVSASDAVPFEEVDEKLKGIMKNIFLNSAAAAEKYGLKGDLVAGANIAGFIKVAEAMKAQGIV